MPFKSKAQAKLMYAVAGNKELSKQLGIPQATAKKMTKEDKGYKNKPMKVKK
jgi:hypothetical protein